MPRKPMKDRKPLAAGEEPEDNQAEMEDEDDREEEARDEDVKALPAPDDQQELGEEPSPEPIKHRAADKLLARGPRAPHMVVAMERQENGAFEGLAPHGDQFHKFTLTTDHPMWEKHSKIAVHVREIVPPDEEMTDVE